jgi:hypothetical protein
MAPMPHNFHMLMSTYALGLSTSSVIAAAALFSIAPAASAGDISFVDQFKNLGFNQTGNGNTLTATGGFYSSDLNSTVANAYTSATMTYPGPGSPATLTQSSPADYHFQTGSFATKAAMDAAFPFGTYTFQGVNGGGTDTAGYSYTADDYAQSNPYLTGTDYTSLQGMNPAQAFTFHLSPYVTGGTATDSFIFLTIYDTNKNMFVFNYGFLVPTTTTITLPANTLAFGHSFIYEVDYSNRDIIAGTGTATFPPQLGFDLRTDGTFSTAAAAVPEPSTAALFGFGLFAALAFCRRRKSSAA